VKRQRRNELRNKRRAEARKATKEAKVKAAMADERVHRIWAHHTSTHHKPYAKLDEDRAIAIWDRLVEGYSEQEICLASDGNLVSDFHQARGRYSGEGKHDDMTLICRDGKHLEKFIGFARNGARRGNGMARPSHQSEFPPLTPEQAKAIMYGQEG
jgi:hypothetical protein